MAAAYGNLGTISQTRSDLEQAEELHRKSLQINEQLGHREGMATAYGNLGVIAQTRSDLEQAEELYRKVSPDQRANWGVGRGWRRTTGTWALSPKPATT